MDVAAQNASLDNDYGTTHGPNAADSFELALFIGDPLADGTEVESITEVDTFDGEGAPTGTELVENGYARAAVAHGDFAPAVDGEKSTPDPVPFPDALAEWPGPATHWQLYDADTGAAWDSGEFAEDGLDVTGPGAGPLVRLSIYYADAVTDPDE